MPLHRAGHVGQGQRNPVHGVDSGIGFGSTATGVMNSAASCCRSDIVNPSKPPREAFGQIFDAIRAQSHSLGDGLHPKAAHPLGGLRLKAHRTLGCHRGDGRVDALVCGAEGRAQGVIAKDTSGPKLRSAPRHDGFRKHCRIGGARHRIKCIDGIVHVGQCPLVVVINRAEQACLLQVVGEAGVH